MANNTLDKIRQQIAAQNKGGQGQAAPTGQMGQPQPNFSLQGGMLNRPGMAPKQLGSAVLSS